jgi:hypothetical protein
LEAWFSFFQSDSINPHEQSQAFRRPAEVLEFQLLEQAFGCVILADQGPLGPFQRITLVPGAVSDQKDDAIEYDCAIHPITA